MATAEDGGGEARFQEAVTRWLEAQGYRDVTGVRIEHSIWAGHDSIGDELEIAVEFAHTQHRADGIGDIPRRGRIPIEAHALGAWIGSLPW